MSETHRDGRIQRGNQTRQMILQRTMQVASVEGLGGLSLGRISNELHLSKSGVFALFGSIEELQLATVHAAIKVYIDKVLQPARTAPAGIDRLWLLCDSWLEYSRTRVFPGGCFFYAVSAEFDARTGHIHDAVAKADANWMEFVENTIEEARQAGDIDPQTDHRQLAFELVALLDAANATSVMHNDMTAYPKARTAILTRLRAIATDPRRLPD